MLEICCKFRASRGYFVVNWGIILSIQTFQSPCKLKKFHFKDALDNKLCPYVIYRYTSSNCSHTETLLIMVKSTGIFSVELDIFNLTENCV